MPEKSILKERILKERILKERILKEHVLKEHILKEHILKERRGALHAPFFYVEVSDRSSLLRRVHHHSLLRRRCLVILRKDRSKLGLCSGQPDTFSSEVEKAEDKDEDKEKATSP